MDLRRVGVGRDEAGQGRGRRRLAVAEHLDGPGRQVAGALGGGEADGCLPYVWGIWPAVLSAAALGVLTPGTIP